MNGATLPRVGVVVLAYGAEPELEPCLQAICASTGVDVDLVVVDNGCTQPGLDELVRGVGGRLLRPEHNTGFAGGCNLGVASLRPGSVVALVNSDAIVEPPALRALVDALTDDVAIATASVRLADQPDTLNSAGNPVHFTGLSWAGALGQPASQHAAPRDVASASGATLAMQRQVWDELGGFDATYFTYLEDTELSLRCWLLGLRVVYVPKALSRHHYAFSRNPLKHYYLERNRLLMVLTLFERRTLLLLAPGLLLWEAAVFVGAVLQGWGRSKLAGWAWLLRNSGSVRRRRAVVQASRRRGDSTLVPLLEGRIAPGPVALPRGFGVLNAVLGAYWRWAGPRIAGTERPSRGE